MEPDNVLMGDTGMGIDLPEATLSDDDLLEEKKMAKYSRTAEFKRIQEHCEARKEFYQKYLPDGRPVAAVPKKDLDSMWIAANVIIAEFDQLINMYENAKVAVDGRV